MAAVYSWINRQLTRAQRVLAPVGSNASYRSFTYDFQTGVICGRFATPWTPQIPSTTPREVPTKFRTGIFIEKTHPLFFDRRWAKWPDSLGFYEGAQRQNRTADTRIFNPLR